LWRAVLGRRVWFAFAVVAVLAVLAVALYGYVLAGRVQPPPEGEGLPEQPAEGSEPSGGQPGGGSGGDQPSNGGSGGGGQPVEPADTAPPSLSADYRLFLPDKIMVTAVVSDASGIREVEVDALGRKPPCPLLTAYMR